MENPKQNTHPVGVVAAALVIALRKESEWHPALYTSDQRRKQLLSDAADEIERLQNAIRSFYTDFEEINWGWDGDCGAARLADALFDRISTP